MASPARSATTVAPRTVPSFLCTTLIKPSVSFSVTAVHALHRHEADADVVSATVLVARLSFGDTRTRNLGVGEGRPRHELCDTLGRAGEQRVAGSDERLITSVVGELRSADHVARRVDVLDVGAQGAVDRYATLCKPYACAQQLHRVDVGSAPS